MATPPPPSPSDPASPAPLPPSPPASHRGSHLLQPPTGTRDFYPEDLRRFRFLQDAWRAASIRHGFDEIDGPTFEHAELYTIKSGEGILSELFSFRRFGGEKDFALRPEFTPTLARMYATKANALPKPTKWFWVQNCFRAERPQRGRLREFYQWNADIVGDDSSLADAEIIALLADFFSTLGLTPKHLRIKVSNRHAIHRSLAHFGVPEHHILDGFNLLDAHAKLTPAEFAQKSRTVGIAVDKFDRWAQFARLVAPASGSIITTDTGDPRTERITPQHIGLFELETLHDHLESMGLLDWIDYQPALARGLAYYTGTVFEVHEASGAERAVAGGGRYDGLVELFGGPPTPAVGFGMGDVVLSLVLQDRGLFPDDAKLTDALGLRPDVFVISAGTPEADAALPGTLMTLRRAGLHARRSYKTTKNVGKLLQDASKAGARFAAIIEADAATATLKDMASGEQRKLPLADLPAEVPPPSPRPSR